MTLQVPKRIAVIPGDGVGPEVIEAARPVLEEAAGAVDLQLEWGYLDWGATYYGRTGKMMPVDAIDILAEFDAIYLGAIGDPAVPDRIAIPELVLTIRRELHQFINYRPVALFPGIISPLRTIHHDSLDILFIRENVEGEYVGAGERIEHGTSAERAIQISVFTRTGIERTARFAFEQAQHRGRRLTSVTKSNVLTHSMGLWDEVVADVAPDFPEVTVVALNVDAAAYHLILRPNSFDVVLASNLFGDILTDLAAAIQGSLGLAASANLDPSGHHPSMFEPVHGSAPDIAGRGIANPTAAIWAGALMLANLGSQIASDRILDALSATFAGGVKTSDLGGSFSTTAFAEQVLSRLREI